MITLTVNGTTHRLDIDPATPLLYTLRGELTWIISARKANRREQRRYAQG